MKLFATVVAACMALASAEVYFEETFDSSAWEDRWVQGQPEGKTIADFNWVTPELSEESNKAIKTSTDYRHFSLSAPLDKPLSNDGKTLALAYTVKHEQNLDCGGAYIKLLAEGYDEKTFGGDTEYRVMFGPDICGSSTRKTHVIFNYPRTGENLLVKKNVRTETDTMSHRYTLVVRPDNTYEVSIDGSKVESGNLADDFDFLPPKTIKDPSVSKPADWVDEAEIPDPDDKKPAGWDDVPMMIPDADAETPDDWDEEEDGEWEAPTVPNPEYKGPWKARMIPNPEYQGPWVHPEIENPDYFEDDKVHAVCNPCTGIGFELWQVKAGTVFDDIIVADSEEELDALEKAFEAKKALEQ
jgi:calreticulin